MNITISVKDDSQMPLKTLKIFNEYQDSTQTFMIAKNISIRLHKKYPNQKFENIYHRFVPFTSGEVYKFSDVPHRKVRIWNHYKKERVIPRTSRGKDKNFDILRFVILHFGCLSLILKFSV